MALKACARHLRRHMNGIRQAAATPVARVVAQPRAHQSRTRVAVECLPLLGSTVMCTVAPRLDTS